MHQEYIIAVYHLHAVFNKLGSFTFDMTTERLSFPSVYILVAFVWQFPTTKINFMYVYVYACSCWCMCRLANNHGLVHLLGSTKYEMCYVILQELGSLQPSIRTQT